MKNGKPLMAIVLALVALGIISIFLQPVLDPRPDSECVPGDQPSSGFMDEEKDCNISIESWEQIADWESKPKPFRIVGVILVLAGIVVGIVALVRAGRDRRHAKPPPAS